MNIQTALNKINGHVESIQSLTADIEEQFAGLVGGSSRGGARGARGGARATSPSRGSTAKKSAKRSSKSTAKKTAKRVTSAKRDPAVLQALVDKLYAYIDKNPGQGIEVIGPAIGTATKELILPMRKLVKDKKIRTEGAKRATKYFPAANAPAAAA